MGDNTQKEGPPRKVRVGTDREAMARILNDLGYLHLHTWRDSGGAQWVSETWQRPHHPDDPFFNARTGMFGVGPSLQVEVEEGHLVTGFVQMEAAEKKDYVLGARLQQLRAAKERVKASIGWSAADQTSFQRVARLSLLKTELLAVANQSWQPEGLWKGWNDDMMIEFIGQFTPSDESSMVELMDKVSRCGTSSNVKMIQRIARGVVLKGQSGYEDRIWSLVQTVGQPAFAYEERPKVWHPEEKRVAEAIVRLQDVVNNLVPDARDSAQKHIDALKDYLEEDPWTVLRS